MPTAKDLDSLPDADQLTTLREKAADSGESVVVSVPTPTDSRKRLVVSPRGTVVLLNDVSEETFNPSDSPAEVAAELRSLLDT